MNAHSIEAVASSAGRRLELTLLLDSGQMYTCLPADVWSYLALVPRRTMSLQRGDGALRGAVVGECMIELAHGAVTTPVILGRPGDLGILGTLTLAELGLVLDPLSRTIEPAEMRLGIAVAAR